MGLALVAYGSAAPSALVWVAALAVFCFVPRTRGAGLTPLAIAVTLFAGWIAATNQWHSQSYTAAAPYHAAFLVAGFLLARRLRSEELTSLYCSALAGGVILSAWALWQALVLGTRGQALFETPATLAAVLNLVLLPGLVLLLSGNRNRLLALALGVLVLGLLAAQSRGGWLGFGAGALAALAFARRAGLPVSKRAAWTSGILVAVGLALCVHSLATAQARLDLYAVALRSMTALFLGTGYLSFYYDLEPVRASVTDYGAGFTYFVHNDYLQTLLELGVPGLLGLFALIFLPLALAWRGCVLQNQETKLHAVAGVAAVVATATHAFVDFPFYVPICLLLFGGALGVLDSGRAIRIHGVSKAIAAALGIWVLATPVVAESAARYAQRQWSAAHNESAAYWFEFARRVTPRDWRYHWYAGQFWQAVAASGGNRRAAALADAAFADGRAANPREARLPGGSIQ